MHVLNLTVKELWWYLLGCGELAVWSWRVALQYLPLWTYFRGIFLLLRISADEVSIVQVNMELTEANMPGASSTCLLSVSCGSLLASRLGKCLLHMRRWFLMMSWRPSALIHNCHFGEGGAWTSCCLLLEYSYKQWMYLQTCCPPQPKQISFWFFQYKGLSTCI